MSDYIDNSVENKKVRSVSINSDFKENWKEKLENYKINLKKKDSVNSDLKKEPAVAVKINVFEVPPIIP